MEPLVGNSKPAMSLKRTLLPLPLGPKIKRYSPFRTDKSIPETAIKLPYSFETFSILSSSMPTALRPMMPLLSCGFFLEGLQNFFGSYGKLLNPNPCCIVYRIGKCCTNSRGRYLSDPFDTEGSSRIIRFNKN